MPIEFKPDITKDLIFKQVSEEEVFERYGVRVENGMFRSPLRNDRHPTCRFYRSKNGKLVLHDFAGFFHGDCIDLVQKLRQCNYPEALEDIAKTFDIFKRGTPRTPYSPPVIIGPKSVCEIRISSMPWDDRHLTWWEAYGVDITLLEKYKVTPVDKVWLNGAMYYNRDFTTKKEVVFAYKFGAFDYKIYFPQRDTKRFLHNNPDILQGYAQLPPGGDVVIITKALKDVICLSMFNIPAIAPMAETSVVSDSVLEVLKDNFKHVYALYDRDRTGMCALVNMRKRGVPPLLMPKGTTKDFADLCKKDYSKAAELAHVFLENL